MNCGMQRRKGTKKRGRNKKEISTFIVHERRNLEKEIGKKEMQKFGR